MRVAKENLFYRSDSRELSSSMKSLNQFIHVATQPFCQELQNWASIPPKSIYFLFFYHFFVFILILLFLSFFLGSNLWKLDKTNSTVSWDVIPNHISLLCDYLASNSTSIYSYLCNATTIWVCLNFF